MGTVIRATSKIGGQYTYDQRNDEAIGPITTVTFTNVPEPPSSVLATIATLAMSAVALSCYSSRPSPH